MHQTTFIPHRLQNACRRRLAGAVLLTAVTLSACQKDEVIMPMTEDVPTRTAMMKVTTPGGLIQQADGTWKTENCRVPLVGPGRIVNDINEQVEVITAGTGTIGNIVDTDLNNHYSAKAVVSAGLLYTPIASVKDMYRVYAPGQKVGFVYKDESGAGLKLLDVDLLNSLSLTTYLRGKKQESSVQSQGGSAIKLDLLALNSGTDVANRTISFEATKPFDEVVLGTQGVKAEAASTISLAIKYAFVGENPEIRATSEAQFADFWTGGTPKAHSTNTGLFENDNNITDDDLTNHVTSSLLGGLLASSTVTLDFKREIPAGAQIGFYYSNDKLIGLDVLKAPGGHLYAYKNDKETDKAEPGTDLLSLSLIGGGKTLVCMDLTKPCDKIKIEVTSGLLNGGLDVGVANYYYGYVCEPVKLDPANEFTFGSDTTYSNSYRLPTVEQGSVQYLVLSSPYGSNPTISKVGEHHVLDGMTHDGAYRVQALYTATDGRQVSHIATIYRKTESRKQGNTYITTRSHGAYATEPIGWQGSLLSLFQGTNNLNNVVDMVQETYATAYKLANVLELEEPVAAFQWDKPIGGNGQEIRTGFVVRAQNHLLDLTALTFFQIRLYKDKQLVDKQGGTKNSTVKLGLLGSSENDKVRISIVTDQEFDRMELWQKGVASVLDNIRLYHIFYEDSDCDPTSEVGGGLELLTNVKDGLVVDYERTKLNGFLAVDEAATELSYLLDGSIASGTVVRATAGSGSTRIALSFKKKTANQPVGIILGEMPSLLDLKLVDIGIFKVFNGDKEVASTEKLGVLGADLISHNGRTYIEVTPEEEFDRVEFTTAAGLSLLENSKICGVYCRNLENTKGNTDGRLTINDGIYHACYEAKLNIPIVNNTLTEDTKVSFYCEDVNDPTDYRRIEATITGGNLVIAGGALPVGRYKITVFDMQGIPLTDNSKLFVYIHPPVATWKRDAATTDWNEWENWEEGSPWSCTDVIIPAYADRYPELAEPKAENLCANIHFESGAEVVGTQHLTMGGKAYVDLSLQGGRNYLLAAPLQEMYTGDMFINPNVPWGKDKYFIPLSEKEYPEMRTSPIVYQRFWSRAAIEKVVGTDGNLAEVEVGTTKWSQEFNAVAEKYTPCQGFSLRAGKTDDFSSYMFRFPKTHEMYKYYTHEGVETGKTETFKRGSFGQLNELPGNVVKLTNKEGTTFLMGNPMMCHLDVAEFLKANTGVSHILAYDGNTYNPIIEVDGQLVSSQTTGNLLIAPMEAFFVVANTATGTLNVTLNESMFRQEASTGSTARKARRSAQPLLRITAAAAGEVASCVVVQSSRASDEYRTGEDAPLLIDGEQRPAVAIFTQAGKEALSIQQIKGATRIPLGLLMKQSDNVTLLFEADGTAWEGWQLTDSLTGKSYPLRGEIRLEHTGNGSDRLYLNKTTK